MPPASSANWVDGALRRAEQALKTADIEMPRFEARLLMALALGVTSTAVLAGLYPLPTLEQQSEFDRLLAERVKRVPLAYLRGTQEFYGLTFAVSPAVLIPRPETELLVEFAREKCAGLPSPRLADVGTGSGCIAIATLAHTPELRALALDLSRDALALARQNAVRNGVADRLRFMRADLLESARAASLDVVVSNPPYIPTAEIATLQAEVRDYEPQLALDGGSDGLILHRRLVVGARRALKPEGWLAVEVALGQAEVVATLFQDAGLVNVETRRDLAGIARVVCGQNPAPSFA